MHRRLPHGREARVRVCPRGGGGSLTEYRRMTEIRSTVVVRMKKLSLDCAFVAWQDHVGQQKQEQEAAAKLEEAGQHAQAEEEEKKPSPPR